MGEGHATAGNQGVSWPSFLRGESADQLFQRMLENDPLRLREACAVRLREVWFLVEPERLFRRACAVCADAARCEAAPGDLATWAKDKIDLAIDQLLREDADSERAHPDQLSEEERSFPLLTKSLFLEPGLVRSASVAFNRLDVLPRRAFYELLILGREVDEVIEAGPWDEDALYVAIHAALATLSLDIASESKDSPAERNEA